MGVTALLLTLIVQPQQPGTTRFAEGQVARVCGEVVSYTTTPRCDIKLVIAESQSEFDVLVPASIWPTLSTRPWHLIGGQVCAAGRISLPPQRVVLNVAAAKDVEVIKPPAGVPFGGDARASCEAGIRAPEIVSEMKPQYTRDAMRARVQGGVEMEAVIDATGSVQDVRVLKSLHPQLDQNAVDALKQWKFRPGTLAGEPVPVVVLVEMTFTLRR